MLSLLTFLFLCNFGASAYLLQRLVVQERRVRRLESSSTNALPMVSASDAKPFKPPLEGLRISLEITQDHPRPVFAQLLKDRLTTEDAIPSISPTAQDQKPDLIVRGTIKCNGYEEVFYEALLDCFSKEGLLLTLSDKPSQGGRQANLATTLVTRIKQELQQSTQRQERQLALDQLNQ
jgi:hypothetical protein